MWCLFFQKTLVFVLWQLPDEPSKRGCGYLRTPLSLRWKRLKPPLGNGLVIKGRLLSQVLPVLKDVFHLTLSFLGSFPAKCHHIWGRFENPREVCQPYLQLEPPACCKYNVFLPSCHLYLLQAYLLEPLWVTVLISVMLGWRQSFWVYSGKEIALDVGGRSWVAEDGIFGVVRETSWNAVGSDGRMCRACRTAGRWTLNSLCTPFGMLCSPFTGMAAWSYIPQTHKIASPFSFYCSDFVQLMVSPGGS